ncbi:TetR/AcrR family transcriptional regulator [Parvibaculum sp.]|uniref:TetR/AcrR family transcriptional regulator n=1 Tax=Parvibaculum sp. TaxID=2024848 RepID=UPI002731F97F|nr:TetR/AcrR family transcriptional regulator [Parvibaculum sp.]MDP1627611.1 TetR/AcrR family transcriptional regulator [Parvibaculum sp.]MDP2148790.1 TetR/AcrR family transcriptional regulator [Parvibaculum sp.]MDP3328686.1 TetR/AcrR family transcriptional regulator [Parvibaculum sp.]
MRQGPGHKEPTRREKRRQAILDAARDVFLQQGYGATSLNDIVGVSGGSLATLYDLFGGKAGLFQEMIEEECQNFFGVLASEDIDERPLREALHVVARQFFDGVIQQPKMSLLRLVIAEAPYFPEVGATFYKAGPARGRQIVSTYLEKQSLRGLLHIGDPARAADVFIALVLGEYQMKVLCGEDVRLAPEEIDRYLDGALDDFLRIYGPEHLKFSTQDADACDA